MPLTPQVLLGRNPKERTGKQGTFFLRLLRAGPTF